MICIRVLVPVESCGAAVAEGAAGVDDAVAQRALHVYRGKALAVGRLAVHHHFDDDVAGLRDVSGQNHNQFFLGAHEPLAGDFSAGDGAFGAETTMGLFFRFRETDGTGVRAIDQT